MVGKMCISVYPIPAREQAATDLTLARTIAAVYPIPAREQAATLLK